jgi:hypothetical protein
MYGIGVDCQGYSDDGISFCMVTEQGGFSPLWLWQWNNNEPPCSTEIQAKPFF